MRNLDRFSTKGERFLDLSNQPIWSKLVRREMPLLWSWSSFSGDDYNDSAPTALAAQPSSTFQFPCCTRFAASAYFCLSIFLS
jgi:hypothetical protein